MSARAASASSSSLEGRHLALDARRVRRALARSLDRLRSTPPAATMWLSLMRTALEVVAVVVRAAAAHRVALERAQAGRGLARVGDARAAPWRQRVDVRARERGDAAHALHEVQRRALAREERPRAALHAEEHRALATRSCRRPRGASASRSGRSVRRRAKRPRRRTRRDRSWRSPGLWPDVGPTVVSVVTSPASEVLGERAIDERVDEPGREEMRERRRYHRSTRHPRRAATRRSFMSGLTTMGFRTRSSKGRSVALSE